MRGYATLNRPGGRTEMDCDDLVKKVRHHVEKQMKKSLGDLDDELKKAQDAHDAQKEKQIKDKIGDVAKGLAKKYGPAGLGELGGAAFAVGTALGDTFATVVAAATKAIFAAGTEEACQNITAAGTGPLPDPPSPTSRRYTCAFRVIGLVEYPDDPRNYTFEVEFSGPKIPKSKVLKVSKDEPEDSAKSRDAEVAYEGGLEYVNLFTNATLKSQTIEDTCAHAHKKSVLDPDPPQVCFRTELYSHATGPCDIVYCAYVYTYAKCEDQ